MKMLLTAAVAAMLMASPALANWTPPGPIKMLIAFRAGGGADTQARLIAEELEKRHGWKIIPEQVTGKGGLNAVKAIKGQAKDGTAIAMIVTGSLGYNMASAKAGKPTDVTPILTTAGTQMAIVALTSKGYKNLGDVIKSAKSGKKIRFGAMTQRLADIAYLVEKANNVDFKIVMVKGGKAVMNGLNAGDLDVGFGAGIQAKAVAAGDMVELASVLSGPLSMTPDAPLLSKYGVKFTSDTAFMFAGPKGMDEKARAAISAAIAEIVQDPSTKAHKFIKKGFGGTKVIRGKDLEVLVQKGFDDAGALMKAVKN